MKLHWRYFLFVYREQQGFCLLKFHISEGVILNLPLYFFSLLLFSEKLLEVQIFCQPFNAHIVVRGKLKFSSSLCEFQLIFCKEILPLVGFPSGTMKYSLMVN